jgi:hypothetical protein
MSYAEIAKYNGEPALMIDGRAYPPMAMTTRIHKPDYIRELGKAGMRIFYIMANTDWLRPGGADRLSGFQKFAEDAEALLREAPDAWIITVLPISTALARRWIITFTTTWPGMTCGTIKCTSC